MKLKLRFIKACGGRFLPHKDRPLTAVFLRAVPIDVVLGFKAYCARRSRTLTDQLILIMKDYIREPDKYPPGKARTALIQLMKRTALSDYKAFG